MKKITLLFLCSILPLAISCTNPMKDFKESNVKAKFRYTQNPDGMKNAKPDAHAAEETAIHVSADDSRLIFVGKEEYALDMLGDKVKSLLVKTPGEKDLIYVNGAQNMKYLDLLKILETLRKQEIENIGLVVTPAVKNDTFFNILKIKMPPEPRMDGNGEEIDSLFKQKFVTLAKDKISFGAYAPKTFEFKPDKEEIKVEDLQAKIAAMLKEREEKKVLVPGTSDVDKRVFIRATKSSDYRKVAQMIDAATGAGAIVYLQIDDLPE